MANINEYSYENVGFNSNLMRAPESDGALIAATSGRDDLLKAEVTTQIQKSKEPAPTTTEQEGFSGFTNVWINSWIKSRNYSPKTKGFYLNGAEGYIECMKLYVGAGGIVGGKIDIPDTTTANSFHTDASGNSWWGCNVASWNSNNDNANAYILKTGKGVFNNIEVRGLIRTACFQKDITSVICGTNITSPNGDVLEENMTALDVSTLTTKGTATFSVNDILQIKDTDNDEWLKVTAVTGNVYTVERDKNGDYSADTNPTWKKGATVVNYGQSGDGGIYQTASASNAPYLSVFTHAGSPWAGLTTRLRVGNLNGYLGYTTDLYGIGIGDATHYLKYDPTNHLRIKGDINASTITGGTIQTSSSGKRIVLAGSDNTLKFYDATSESLSIGTAGGQAINITGNATTTRGVAMTSTVAGSGFVYTNEGDVQNIGLDLAMGVGVGLTNSLPSIRIKMGGTGEVLWGDINSTGRGIHITRSIGAGTANLLKLSSTNLVGGTIADITRSGSGVITALNIDHATSSNSINTGIVMSLSSGNASLCYAFRFNGSEIVSSVVGGTQNKKIRVSISGTDYFLPLHTA